MKTIKKQNYKHMQLLTKKEVAKLLKTSTRNIDRWRLAGAKLGVVKLGEKTIRFKASEIEKLIDLNSLA